MRGVRYREVPHRLHGLIVAPAVASAPDISAPGTGSIFPGFRATGQLGAGRRAEHLGTTTSQPCTDRAEHCLVTAATSAPAAGLENSGVQIALADQQRGGSAGCKCLVQTSTSAGQESKRGNGVRQATAHWGSIMAAKGLPLDRWFGVFGW